MPFEDVGYLKDHSIKESYTFFVDSNDRNRVVHPNPNEYTLNFESPFTNVYSFEVLDASIPRTQYSVDTGNNKLVFRYSASTEDTLDTEGYIEIELGDYTDSNLVNEINTKMATFFVNVNLQGSTIYCKTTSMPSNQKYTLTFYSKRFFVIDRNKSTIRTTLGFDTLPISNDIEDSILKYETTDFVTGNLFVDSTKFVDVSFADSMIDNNDYFAATRVNDFEFPFHESISALENIVVDNGLFLTGYDSTHNTISQKFTTYKTGNLDFINIYHDYGVTATITFEIYKVVSTTDTLIKSQNIAIDVDNVQTQITFDRTYVIEKDEQYKIKMIVPNNSILGNISVVVDVDGDYLETMSTVFAEAGNSGTPVSQNYNIVFDIFILEQNYTIIAPNMYSLIGDRYTLLKCPEIESHLHGSKAYEKYSQGLAKFKLSVIGYDESRFDFASLTPRTFHPIARLSHLTLQFKRPNGMFYNFRGMNHTITFCIKYYTPKPNIKFEKSILAPDYDPDYFRYLQNQESESESGSSESDDER